MTTEFHVQVQGDRELLQVLADLRKRAADLRAAWETIGDLLVNNADQRFETKTDPAGRPWDKWADSTKKARQKSGRGTLLELTRLMRSSLNSSADSDGVTLGLGRSYAPYHERGTRNKDGTQRMPRRAMFLASTDPATLGDEDRQIVLDILMEHLHG